MGKIKKTVLIFLACATVLMAAFQIWERLVLDTEPPQISCPEEALEVRVSADEEQLLAGVTARDNRDGDAAVFLERLSPMTQEHTRIATYAAADRTGNVSRASRTIRYTDYEPPRFESTRPMRLPTETPGDVLLQGLTVTDVTGADLTEQVRCTILHATPFGYAVEFSVKDTMGYHAAVEMDVERYSPSEERLTVELTDYIVTLEQNDPFSPADYCLDPADSTKLRIRSTVNPAQPGTYHVSYELRDETGSVGRSWLVVVVEASGREAQ